MKIIYLSHSVLRQIHEWIVEPWRMTALHSVADQRSFRTLFSVTSRRSEVSCVLQFQLPLSSTRLQASQGTASTLGAPQFPLSGTFSSPLYAFARIFVRGSSLIDCSFATITTCRWRHTAKVLIQAGNENPISIALGIERTS
jgi:hypothetical protein